MRYELISSAETIHISLFMFPEKMSAIGDIRQMFYYLSSHFHLDMMFISRTHSD